MRLPAEWEPQGFVQLTWPHKDSLWYEVEKVQDCYTRIVTAILCHEPVLMVCRDQAECEEDLRRCGLASTNGIRFVECPINDTWARDHGAISVYGEAGEKIILDFVFNGWGLKFWTTRSPARPSPVALSARMCSTRICVPMYWKAAA